MGEMDEIGGGDNADSEDFTSSDSFFCCGYMLHMRLVKRADLKVRCAISYDGPALDFVELAQLTAGPL